jgi:hypothetical protein
VEAEGAVGSGWQEAGNGHQARKRPWRGKPVRVVELGAERAGGQSAGNRSGRPGTLTPEWKALKGAAVAGERKAVTGFRSRWSKRERRVRSVDPRHGENRPWGAKGKAHGVLHCEALAVHAGGELSWESGHLEPFSF